MKAIRLLSVGLLAAFGVWATDVSGKWISETPVRDGNTATVTMKFKTDHDKLTGTISGPSGEAEISNGEIEGSRVSFSVPRDRNGTKFDQHYKGTVEGDTIHFTVTFGDTNFNARRKFDAKRE
jgi:hypothetical protein